MLFVCAICALSETKNAITSVGMMAWTSIVITIYASIRRTEFTVCSGVFLILGSTCLYSLVCGLLINDLDVWLLILFTAIYVVVYNLVLVYDVQLHATGTKYELKYDEYVFGTLAIHCDIVVGIIERALRDSTNVHH